MQELAARFDSNQCQNAIAGLLPLWQRSSAPDRNKLDGAQEVISCPFQRDDGSTFNLHYVRNQKAASTFLYTPHRYMKPVDGRKARCKQSYQPTIKTMDTSLLSTSFSWPAQDDMVWTVVRHPIMTAISAYLEVSRRVPLPNVPNCPHTSSQR